MSDKQQTAVSKRRAWLEDVQNQLSQTKWSLLLLAYILEFPYGHLQQLNDVADLYNKLIEKHNFTSDESFQILLRRLSFLKDEGMRCIRALNKHGLAQPESIPDLPSKLSHKSLLVECIVRTLVELAPVKRRDLLEHLAWEHLQTHEDKLTSLELFSKLFQSNILGVCNTQPLIDGLKHVRAPPDVLCHLRDYHEKHGLGDIEYFEVVSSPGSLTPEIRRPVSGSQTNQTGGITNPGHEIHTTQHAPNLVVAQPPSLIVSHSASNTEVPPTPESHPPHQGNNRQSSSDREPLLPPNGRGCFQTTTKKSGLLATLGGFVVVLLLALVGLVVTFAVIHPSHTSSYLAYADGVDANISLGTVNTFWYSSVTIEEYEEEGDNLHSATIYVVPSSEVKQHEYNASHSCLSGPYNSNIRTAGRFENVYLFEGASFEYTVCLNNYSSNATAVAFIFDSYTAFKEFIDHKSDGYQSSVYHQNLPIASGTSVYSCSSIAFTSPRDAYYSVTTEITFDDSGNTGHQIDTECTITTHIKYFNHSEYSESCIFSLDQSKTCDVNLFNLTNLFETYKVLAFVQKREEFFSPSVHFTVHVRKNWYIFGFGIFMCIVFFVCLLCIILCLCRRPIHVCCNQASNAN